MSAHERAYAGSARVRGMSVARVRQRQAERKQDATGLLAFPSHEAFRRWIEAGICPFCGSGPWHVLAGHTTRVHAVDRYSLREMAGLPYRSSLTSAEYNLSRSAITRQMMADGRFLPGHKADGQQVRHSGPQPRRGPMQHGTNSTYTSGCHCDTCRAAHAAYATELRRAKGVKPMRRAEHGSKAKYSSGCRCDACRAAHAAAAREKRARQRASEEAA